MKIIKSKTIAINSFPSTINSEKFNAKIIVSKPTYELDSEAESPNPDWFKGRQSNVYLIRNNSKIKELGNDIFSVDRGPILGYVKVSDSNRIAVVIKSIPQSNGSPDDIYYDLKIIGSHLSANFRPPNSVEAKSLEISSKSKK